MTKTFRDTHKKRVVVFILSQPETNLLLLIFHCWLSSVFLLGKHVNFYEKLSFYVTLRNRLYSGWYPLWSHSLKFRSSFTFSTRWHPNVLPTFPQITIFSSVLYYVISGRVERAACILFRARWKASAIRTKYVRETVVWRYS